MRSLRKLRPVECRQSAIPPRQLRPTRSFEQPLLVLPDRQPGHPVSMAPCNIRKFFRCPPGFHESAEDQRAEHRNGLLVSAWGLPTAGRQPLDGRHSCCSRSLAHQPGPTGTNHGPLEEREASARNGPLPGSARSPVSRVRRQAEALPSLARTSSVAGGLHGRSCPPGRPGGAQDQPLGRDAVSGGGRRKPRAAQADRLSE